MKVTKQGTVKLEKGEVRIGNFFVKSEESHYKIQDINALFVHRVSKSIPVGIWIGNMLTEQGDGGLESLRTYIATMWSVFSPAPDNDYINALLMDAGACLERHSEWYGIKRGATDEEDAEALKEVEEMSQFEEDVKNMSDKDSKGDAE